MHLKLIWIFFKNFAASCFNNLNFAHSTTQNLAYFVFFWKYFFFKDIQSTHVKSNYQTDEKKKQIFILYIERVYSCKEIQFVFFFTERRRRTG